MDVTFLLFFAFLVLVIICLTGAIVASKDSKENKNGTYSDYSSLSDMYSHDRPRYKKPTRRERSSWQDEYNRGLKAGREDALFNDGYGYFRGHDRNKSDAYRAGYQAGHEEED